MSRARAENTVRYLDAVELARTNSTWECEFARTRFPRLAEALVSATPSVSVRLRFALTEGRPWVHGQLSAELELTCQRCLKPLQYRVDESFELLLLASEEELKAVPESQDALVVEATRLDVHWLVEEQVLLALPLIPKHENADECEGAPVRLIEEAQILDNEKDEPAAQERQKPFQNLRELLGNKR